MLESTVSKEDRYHPTGCGTKFGDEELKGFSDEQAVMESARCLHCDCRAKDNCDLRDYSEMFGAKQNRFTGRRPHHWRHERR